MGAAVDHLAAIAGASPAHFSREFRRAFGETPHQYLLTRRLERAEMDLQRLEDVISEVETKVRSLARQKGKAQRYTEYRQRRLDKLVTRLIPSWIANRLIRWITGVPIRDNGCSLKAYRRDVLKDVKLYGEMHRFIPIYAKWEGARITEMVVSHHPRRYGLRRGRLAWRGARLRGGEFPMRPARSLRASRGPRRSGSSWAISTPCG